MTGMELHYATRCIRQEDNGGGGKPPPYLQDAQGDGAWAGDKPRPTEKPRKAAGASPRPTLPQTMRLNCLSSSVFVSLTQTGRPWGQ